MPSARLAPLVPLAMRRSMITALSERLKKIAASDADCSAVLTKVGPLVFAQRLEGRLFSSLKNEPVLYRRYCVSLLFNLNFNGKYLLRTYPNPSLLASLDSVELGRGTSAEAYVKSYAERQKKLQELIAGRGGLKSANRSLFKCRTCGPKSICDWTSMQTRSADEPETKWITCTTCGKTWREG